jgi:hypothetical protein
MSSIVELGVFRGNNRRAHGLITKWPDTFTMIQDVNSMRGEDPANIEIYFDDQEGEAYG